MEIKSLHLMSSWSQILDDDNYKDYVPTEEQLKADDEWMELVDNLKLNFSIPTGNWLYKIFCKAGYGKNESKEHKIFEYWMYDYIGKIIQEFENSK